MPLEEVVAGVTFQGFATTPPVIPGLQALGIFGTTKDGNNGNRAAGGPAFANLTNPPTIGNAWITVNNGTATTTPTTGIDTGVFETTAILAGGWTIFGVIRTAIASGNAVTLAVGPGQSTMMVLNPVNNTISNHPSVSLVGVTFPVPAAETTIDLSPNSLSNWRMYAFSYPAGSGARVYTVTDVTGGVVKTATTTHARTIVGTTNRFCFGNNASSSTNVNQFADITAGGVATQALTLPQLQSIRTWLLGVLGVRGITGF